jgi:GDPmannose 4,6-dehydratase
MNVLVTGIGGQDGYYLSEVLLRAGECVWGILRCEDSAPALAPLRNLYGERLQLRFGDAGDCAFLREVICAVPFDRIYNFAAQSRVGQSFEIPEATFRVNALVPLHLLEIIRTHDPRIRLLQACSAEVFGENAPVPQNEATPFAPVSPYAVSKASAYWMVRTYRRAYNLFACNAILYNHESPLRDESFVSGKVARAVARIVHKRQQTLTLGNLEVKRDWGFAGDYVGAMQLMMDHPEAEDYVVASGQTHSVGEFVELAFAHAGLDWRKHVEVDRSLYRPTDAKLMMGDATRARTQLGWKPDCDFPTLVRMLVDAALERERAAEPRSSTMTGVEK